MLTLNKKSPFLEAVHEGLEADGGLAEPGRSKPPLPEVRA